MAAFIIIAREEEEASLLTTSNHHALEHPITSLTPSKQHARALFNLQRRPAELNKRVKFSALIITKIDRGGNDDLNPLRLPQQVDYHSRQSTSATEEPHETTKCQKTISSKSLLNNEHIPQDLPLLALPCSSMSTQHF